MGYGGYSGLGNYNDRFYNQNIPVQTYIPSTGVTQPRGDQLGTPTLDPLPTPQTNIPSFVSPSPMQSQMNPQTGFGGKTAGAANMATNFLQGWIQGKNTSEAKKRQDAQQKLAAAYMGYNVAKQNSQTIANQIGVMESKYAGKPVDQWGNPQDQQAYNNLKTSFQSVSQAVPGFAGIYADLVRQYTGGEKQAKGGKQAKAAHPYEALVEPALQHLENHPPMDLPQGQQPPAQGAPPVVAAPEQHPVAMPPQKFTPNSAPQLEAATQQIAAQPAPPAAAPAPAVQPAPASAPQQTQLTPEQEQQFQQWKAKYAPNDSGQDYDLRGAFKAGVVPAANGHMPDTFKLPNHPTFSNESQYATPNAPHWEGGKLVGPGGQVVANESAPAPGIAGVARNVLSGIGSRFSRALLPQKPNFFAPGTAENWQAATQAPIMADPDVVARAQTLQAQAATSGAQARAAERQTALIKDYDTNYAGFMQKIKANPGYADTNEGKADAAYLTHMAGALRSASPAAATTEQAHASTAKSQASTAQSQASVAAEQGAWMTDAYQKLRKGEAPDFYQAQAMGFNPKDLFGLYMKVYPDQPELAAKKYIDAEVSMRGARSPVALIREGVRQQLREEMGREPTESEVNLGFAQRYKPTPGERADARGTKVLTPSQVPAATQEIFERILRDHPEYGKQIGKDKHGRLVMNSAPTEGFLTSPASVEAWKGTQQKMIADTTQLMRESDYDGASIARVLGMPAPGAATAGANPGAHKGGRPAATPNSVPPGGSLSYDVTVKDANGQPKTLRLTGRTQYQYQQDLQKAQGKGGTATLVK